MTLFPKIASVLELSRWAPSGDNTQPWRFELIDEHHFAIHGFDTRDHCVYDVDGRPSQMSLGALIETVSIAASAAGFAANVLRRAGTDRQPVFDVRLRFEAGLPRSPLVDSIPERSVQRRAMRTRRLERGEKEALESAAPGYRLVWFEDPGARWACARLMFDNARIRLTMPEAYEVHRSIIDWGRRHSEDKVPDQALGADAMTLKLMRFAMQRWDRIEFMNRWLAGTVAPRLQMDLWPGVACAGHFVMLADRVPATIDDWVDAGRAMQRVWLTATSLGLQKQPELTPLVFARYVDAGRTFSRVSSLHKDARRLRDRLASLVGADLSRAVWMARIGHGRPPRARSLRLPLERLLIQPGEPPQEAG